MSRTAPRAFSGVVAVVSVALLIAPATLGGGEVPTPAAVLGFDPTATASVVDASHVARYCRAVDRASERVELRAIGLSTEGSPLWLVMVSAPENLSRWREASRQRDKVFALVTCGIHPIEVGSTASFFPLLHKLATTREARYRELLDRVILLVIPCVNPDGTDRIAAWLNEDGAERARIPPLYHRYCGHDLNRDWLLGTQAETRVIVRRVHHAFFPWLTIDLHQMGRLGPRVFIPPYAEPTDPAIAPDIRSHVDLLGHRVFDALRQAGRRGVARRWLYDAWSPARAYPFYHGGLRFLVEVASGRSVYPHVAKEADLRAFGTGNDATPDHPLPWKGGSWGLPEITDVMVSATLKTLLALLEEPLGSAQGAHFRSAARRTGGFFLDARGDDPGVVAAFLQSLAATGARVTPGDTSSTWILRDPAWGIGWCRSLLLCTPYPTREATSRPDGGGPDRGGGRGRNGFNDTPYDTSTHDLGHMAGLRIAAWTPPPGTIAPAETRDEGAVAAWLEGAAQTSPTPSVPPGRMQPLPGALQEADWFVSQRSISTLRELPDLIEAGVRIERFSVDVELETGAARAGDFLFRGIHRQWVERLVDDGADAYALDPAAIEVLRRDNRLVEFRYPRLWVLQGPLAAMDEGWIRWVLEAYRFRFRRITLDELLVDRDFGHSGTSHGWGRDVLIVPEGTLRRVRPPLKRVLDDFVERGGRVIALGRAAKWMARTCRLPVAEIPLESQALPGTCLRTTVTARAGSRDPILWGYHRAPDVFYDRGPLWWLPDKRRQDEVDVAREALLGFPGKGALLCGVLDPRHAERIRGAVPLVRLRRRAAGGEWLLCGFRPHYRGWTLGTYRLLFNMMLAPAKKQGVRGSGFGVRKRPGAV